MTEKIYEQAPFLVKFEAKVLSCEKGKKGFDIVLDIHGDRKSVV